MKKDKKMVRLLVTGGAGFIGTNLIEEARKYKNIEIVNVDINSPLYPKHRTFWVHVDILNRSALEKLFKEFRPNWVVHLAARTDCNENTTVEQDYRVNTEGTENVISAIKATPSVARIVITSTQYVHRPGHIPTDDEDYEPHTVYGQSKVITENLTRQANLKCTWTIIRPTNVWGPWHMRYKDQFLNVLQKGLYFHPGRQKCIKSYGYVGNVVRQIFEIMQAPECDVNGKVLYVGDAPLDILDWINQFSRELRGRNVRIIPRFLVRGMALFGDVISFVTQKPFLITSSRFKNMTEDYLTPMQRTFDILGNPPISLDEGIRETVAWLKAY